MYKNKIKVKKFLIPILTLVIGSIISISLVNLYLSINLFDRHTQEHISESKKEFHESHTKNIKKQVNLIKDAIEFHRSRVEKELKNELSSRINIARSISESIYTQFKGKLSDHEMRKLIAEQLANVRFDKENRGYYFAYKNSTRIVYEHIHKETIGTYMGGVKDTKGVNVALAHDNALASGEEIGFVKRYFYKPGNRKEGFPKLVAVTLFKPLDLLIGTGEYLDVIENRLKKLVINRFKNFNANKNITTGILELHNINGGKEFATLLVSTNNTKLIGEKLDDSFKDAKGKEFRKKYLNDLRKDGESYIEHWYVKPNESEEKRIYSYFYLQKDWNWIIVSSFYLDDLEAQIQELETAAFEFKKGTLLEVITFIAMVSFLVIVIAVVIALIIDRTIRRYTNEILQNKLELEYAQKVAKMSSWTLNHKTKKMSISTETFPVFEVDTTKVNRKNLTVEPFRQKVHAEDLESFDTGYAQLATQDETTFTFRVVMEDGRVKYILAKGETSFKNGKPIITNGIVQDITEEYLKSEELKRNELLLMEKEKLASMGEMIGNIAHQWRQPLSVISTCATGMSMKKEFDLLSDEEFTKNCHLINENAQYLSTTIEDFRNFIKGDRTIKLINLQENIDSFLHLVNGVLKSEQIDVSMNIKEKISFPAYPNELIQCYINIFNNSKDAFNINKVQKRVFIIDANMVEDKVVIKLKDNAGGIPERIVKKVFDPYFTTKHNSQGTGLGLNMTYRLVTEGMKGEISVENVDFSYEDQNYTGAEFTIVLPLESLGN